MKSDLTICIAGKNQIAVDGLRLALKEYGKERVVVCPNRGDDGVSRWQPSLLRFANEWGVRVVQLDQLYDEDNLVFFSLEFDRIISPSRFKASKLFNIHFSMLPKYKGMYTSAWPILNGESASGVTLHEIDDGIDTGAIIDQIDIPLGPDASARDLYFSYLRAGTALLKRHMRMLAEGASPAIAQSAADSSYYAKSSINYAGLVLNLRNTAESITRQARAFDFREFQIPQIDGFALGKARIEDRRSTGKPGQVTADGADAIVVASIDFDVRFERNCSWDFFRMANNADIAGILSYPPGSDLINYTNGDGWTPLMMAAYRGDLDVCSALVEAGADVNLANQNGTTPLMYAKNCGVRSDDFSVCKLLLDSGADVQQKDLFLRTVVDYAIREQQQSAINFFGKMHNA
jgi:methionyl-tRNA formyltransferase